MRWRLRSTDASDEIGLGFRSGRVKRLRRLLARRTAREAEGVCVVEGERSLVAALDARANFEVVYAAPDAPRRCGDLLGVLTERGVTVEWLAEGVLERVSGTVTPQPVVGVVRTPEWTLDDVVAARLLVVLAEVREPGNAGTIVRGAEAAGASAVVFCRGSADPWSPKVVRASAGALFQLPVVSAGGSREVLDVLAHRGVRRLGTAARGGEPYDRVDWSVPSAVVLGNEAWGVPPEAASAIDGWVSIPVDGHADSLNVAMAASVLLFEAARQRRAGE